MRYSFFLLVIFIFAISCGKKREIIAEGNTRMSFADIHYQTYIENDTFYKTFTDKGKLVMLLTALSESGFNDSSFLEKRFSPNGRMIQVGNYKKGKREGEWLDFYPSGRKESRNMYQDGVQLNYEVWYESGQMQIRATLENGVHRNFETWYESGQLEIKEELISDTNFQNHEYFENGVLMKEVATDRKGNGSCKYYHLNGKIKQSGQLLEFQPSGIWKIYDSAGIQTHDTLFLADGPLKSK